MVGDGDRVEHPRVSHEPCGVLLSLRAVHVRGGAAVVTIVRVRPEHRSRVGVFDGESTFV